jgi:hypothetical protein
VFKADGSDLASVFSATRDATAWVRRGKPAVVVFENVPRRFGHAATDRQGAYLPAAAIANKADHNPLGMACAAAVDEGQATYAELAACWATSQALARDAFEQASAEPKLETLGAEGMVARNHVALPPALAALSSSSQGVEPSGLPSLAALGASAAAKGASEAVIASEGGSERRNVMRKHMTACLEESLKERPNLVSGVGGAAPSLKTVLNCFKATPWCARVCVRARLRGYFRLPFSRAEPLSTITPCL